jgi:hypothetical protein
MRVARALVPAFVALGAASCAGGNAASQLVKAPAYEPVGQTQCSVGKSQTRPLIVEWPSSDRLELETKARDGVVVVRYVGCDMDVLERCSVAAKYRYLAGTRKQDKLVLTNADDLYANLPVGAAKLEGTLERSGQLTVDMDLVGRFEADTPTLRAEDLQGDCAGATHFVYGVTVGAFDFYAGGAASIGAGAGAGGAGVGAHSKAERQTITRDGDVGACDKSNPDDKTPPPQCGALVRIEVVPLANVKPNPFLGEWSCTETVRVPSGQEAKAERVDVITDNGDGSIQVVSRMPTITASCSKRYILSAAHAVLDGAQSCTIGGRVITAKSAELVSNGTTYTDHGVGNVPGVGDVDVSGTCTRR